MEIFVSEKELKASCDNYEFGKELVEEIVSQDSVLFKSLEQHDKKLLQEFANDIKKLFYEEFDEIIPSVMAEKIDNLLKERGV